MGFMLEWFAYEFPIIFNVIGDQLAYCNIQIHSKDTFFIPELQMTIAFVFVSSGFQLSISWPWLIISGALGIVKSLIIFSVLFADKPPLEELHQFLEFQLPRTWAPVFSELPLGPQRRQQNYASLQFSFMGPKLYVNTTPVVFLWYSF